MLSGKAANVQSKTLEIIQEVYRVIDQDYFKRLNESLNNAWWGTDVPIPLGAFYVFHVYV